MDRDFNKISRETLYDTCRIDINFKTNTPNTNKVVNLNVLWYLQTRVQKKINRPVRVGPGRTYLNRWKLFHFFHTKVIVLNTCAARYNIANRSMDVFRTNNNGPRVSRWYIDSRLCNAPYENIKIFSYVPIVYVPTYTAQCAGYSGTRWRPGSRVLFEK